MKKLKILILLLGDIFFFYAALVITLIIRYGFADYAKPFMNHLAPFSAVLFLWSIVFYVLGLIEISNLKNDLRFFQTLGTGMGVVLLLALAFFYVAPGIGIAPKTNLIIFIIIFGLLEIGWRSIFNGFATVGPPKKIIFVGDTPEIKELVHYLHNNPQLGYEVAGQTNKVNEVSREGATAVVIPSHIKKDRESVKVLYSYLNRGIQIIDFTTLYEEVFKKTPLNELEEEWFLDHLGATGKFYETYLKNAIERIMALVFLIIISPIIFLISIGIKLTSKGPIIYKQTRIGKGGNPFILYKFRTMREDAEKAGPQWASGTKDPRVTLVGRFLRASHLDEVPQLINILKGELSFVGPRPERPEFVKILSEKIPYFDIRHIIRPGISGWAQINYRYTASVEDAVQKLQYDIYYLKNRSFILDMIIIVKTVKMFFVTPK